MLKYSKNVIIFTSNKFQESGLGLGTTLSFATVIIVPSLAIAKITKIMVGYKNPHPTVNMKKVVTSLMDTMSA